MFLIKKYNKNELESFLTNVNGESIKKWPGLLW